MTRYAHWCATVTFLLGGGLAAQPVATPPAREWLAPELPFRAHLRVAPMRRDRRDLTVFCTPDIAARLGEMGLGGDADLGLARLFALTDDDTGAEIPFGLDGTRFAFSIHGALPAEEARTFDLYFATGAVGDAPVDKLMPAPADYAIEAYGDAWDFDEGDTEAIDNFGDRPEYIRNVRAEDGALCATVITDPYIVWGAMWGREDAGQRLVRIDVADTNLLTMRIKQSLPSAEWTVYGRALGSESLQRHRMVVNGTDWQTVEVDLYREAGWRGVLSAFRVGLTCDTEAEIAIDSVRLVRGAEATCVGVETLGSPSGGATTVALDMPDVAPEAGADQQLVATVLDATGRPVSGQPVRLRIAPADAGSLASDASLVQELPDGEWLGLTDDDGRLVVRYTAGRRAGEAAIVSASAEFTTAAPASAEVTPQPGPATGYRVGTGYVVIRHESEGPYTLQAVPIDACGNEVNLPGRMLTWAVDGGGIIADGNTATLTPDMASRWVYEVRVTDDQGLTGASAPLCVLPEADSEAKVVLAGNGRFQTRSGEPFVPLGGFYAVWVPRIAGPGEEEGRSLGAFTTATEEEMRHWFAYLNSQGINAMRLMLRTHGPGGTEALDAGGKVNPRLFARILRLLDLGRQYGLRFMLTLHDDYDKPVYCNETHLVNFALPAFEGVDLAALPPHQRRFLVDRDLVPPPERYTDPDAIACQDQYAREVVGYLKDNPALFSWELENEMVACPVSWVNHAIEVIREVDPVTPVCVSHGGGGLETADPVFWVNTEADFYSYHLYPLGTTTPEMDYGLGVDVLTRYGRMAGVCFLGESSGDEFSSYPQERDDDRRYIMRDIIWLSLINDNPGCFFWNARGKEIEEFALAREVTDRIDWTRWERKRPQVAVDVSHSTDHDLTYRTPEGRADLAMMARYARHFARLGVDFDFTMSPEGHASVCSLAEFAPPEAEPEFPITPGFELTSLTRADEGQGLAYVRCISAIRPWSPQEGRTMYLRDRAPADLRIGLNLPHPEVRLSVFDLDTREETTVVLPGDGSLDLGITDHDFAILWAPM